MNNAVKRKMLEQRLINAAHLVATGFGPPSFFKGNKGLVARLVRASVALRRHCGDQEKL